LDRLLIGIGGLCASGLGNLSLELSPFKHLVSLSTSGIVQARLELGGETLELTLLLSHLLSGQGSLGFSTSISSGFHVAVAVFLKVVARLGLNLDCDFTGGVSRDDVLIVGIASEAHHTGCELEDSLEALGLLFLKLGGGVLSFLNTLGFSFLQFLGLCFRVLFSLFFSSSLFDTLSNVGVRSFVSGFLWLFSLSGTGFGVFASSSFFLSKESESSKSSFLLFENSFSS